jgi:hypothetical protein
LRVIKKMFSAHRIVNEKFLALAMMRRKSESYNKTKRRALEVLEDCTPMDGPTFARKLHFQMTERGLERLKWLRDQDKTLRFGTTDFAGSSEQRGGDQKLGAGVLVGEHSLAWFTS